MQMTTTLELPKNLISAKNLILSIKFMFDHHRNTSGKLFNLEHPFSLNFPHKWKSQLFLQDSARKLGFPLSLYHLLKCSFYNSTPWFLVIFVVWEIEARAWYNPDKCFLTKLISLGLLLFKFCNKFSLNCPYWQSSWLSLPSNWDYRPVPLGSASTTYFRVFVVEI